jgi:hypothetical protein
MIDRRSFLKSALLGGAAFGAGYKLSDALDGAAAGPVVLHGFVPADEAAVRGVLETFLALDAGRLPAPIVDVVPAWRRTVAGSLQQAADRYQRPGQRQFAVQVASLDEALPADLMLQQQARVLDPDRGFGRGLLELRERLRGRDATVAVTCRLEDRPDALAGDRVLVIEDERGEHDRIALAGAARRLELTGPAGKTAVLVGADGARVTASSCRHATCRRQGTVSRPGELIACAPNRLVLRVETA